MIAWLVSLDGALFHWINLSLANPIFDRLMPLFSDPPALGACLVVLFLLALWKGNARARLCVTFVILTLCVGDWIIADLLKHVFARPRPFYRFEDARLLVGKSGSYSMPSSHAMNWFGAAMVTFVYYRRSIYAMLPLAVIVGFSRIYNGVHYPSDVLAGAILGAGCGAAVITAVDTLWQRIGPAWFASWWKELPSLRSPATRDLVNPPNGQTAANPQTVGRAGAADGQWVRLGMVWIAVLLVVRLAYLAAGKIELSEDEAYQWIWSKHLALSYYSKPLLIALTQFMGTHLWGNNEFGVRFFSPVIAAVLSLLLLRFLAREIDGRTAFVFLLIVSVAPLMAVGATLMTVDPLSVLFWTAAMVTGWSATQPQGTTRQWLWVGLWMGLGFLSKYTNLVQLICWTLFFLLWPPARKHLRRPGPYLALLIVVVSTLPVVLWNLQHGWITAKHVWSDGQLSDRWHRTYTLEFLLTEAGLLHPVFFVGALWAAIAFWRHSRGAKPGVGGERPRPENSPAYPLELFLFSMGAPVFLMYFLISFHSRIEGNWIAPSVLPLFCLMAVYWRRRWQRGARALKPLLFASIAIGALGVVILHDTNLATKILGRSLPARLDPLHRVHGWKQLAQIAGRARMEMEHSERKPVFIICEHYGFTSQITFYLPEAKMGVPNDPLVYFYCSPTPRNQFYFWPGYEHRAGQNAIFVREVEAPKLRPDWLSRWWRHDPYLYLTNTPPVEPLPPEVRKQFDSIKFLGLKDVAYEGQGIMRRAQLFECRNLH